MAWSSWAASSKSETKKHERTMREGWLKMIHQEIQQRKAEAEAISGMMNASGFTPVYYRNGGQELPSERGSVNSAGTIETSDSSTMDANTHQLQLQLDIHHHRAWGGRGLPKGSTSESK
jgi:hypothetical protein